MICEHTGHKIYWWDHKEWKERQKQYDSKFWDEYRIYHKGTGDEVCKQVFKDASIKSKWARLALNSCTQGTGAIIIKEAATQLFNWIVDNDYFNKIKICNLVHDEILAECPEGIIDTFKPMLEKIMLDAAAKYCKRLPIPAEAEVSKCWKH